MTWIAAADRIGSWRDPALVAAQMSGQDGLLRKGALHLEVTAPTVATGAVLVRVRRAAKLDGLVSAQWVPSLGIVVLITRGEEVWHLRLPLTETPDRLSITLSWDQTGKTRLSAEQPDGPVFATLACDTSPPLRLSDVWALSKAAETGQLGSAAVGLAVADGPVPIGPWPTLSEDTPIDTPHGPVPIHSLKPGDTVRTWTGDVVPVLHVLRQSVPAIGRLRPVTLRAAALGCARDITVASSQRLVVGGVEIREAYGCNTVRMTVGDLPPATRTTADNSGQTVFAQLVLPEGEAILSQGLSLESLRFDALKRDWTRFGLGLLANCPWHQLPTHPPSSYPLLRAADVARLTEPKRASA